MANYKKVTIQCAAILLNSLCVLHKGRMVKPRTIRTMIDKGLISVEMCECGISKMVDVNEIIKVLKSEK